MDIIVIGAGLGGLATACLLASKGHGVTIFERNQRPGGKIGEIESHGFRFDTSPSLLTMPSVLESFFLNCGHSIHNFLSIEPVDPICRYFFNSVVEFYLIGRASCRERLWLCR